MGWIVRFGRAVAALAALAVLVVAPPLLLMSFVGNPWPQGGVDLGAPLTDAAIIGLLAAICWVLWAQLAVCVLAEVTSQLRSRVTPGRRGVVVPVRVPATFGMQQRLARILVTSVIGVSIAAPLTAGLASAVPAPPVNHAPVAVAVAHVSKRAPAPAAATQQQRLRTVQVARGDTLWSLAEKHLGGGEDWTKIAHLNRGHTMSDGATFRSENDIMPGWELEMPATATGLSQPGGPVAHSGQPVLVTVKPGDTLSGIAQKTLGDGHDWQELWQANKALIDDPDLILPGWQLTIPTVVQHTAPVGGRTQPPAPTPAAHEGQQQHRPVSHVGADQRTPPVQSQQPASIAPTERQHPANPQHVTTNQAPARADQQTSATDSGFSLQAACGIGSLLCAGILVLLGIRRGQQRRRRPIGGRLPMPTGAAAAVEADLRANQDPVSVETVDRALRSLATACAATGQPLPVVKAARLTAEAFELYLAEPAHLPSPWTAAVDQTVWTVNNDAVDPVDVDVANPVAAPYPALVTLGHDDENGHILVDLEHCGTLGLVGDADAARPVLLALAVELATSRWADDLLVTVVGVGPELETVLATGKIAYRPTIGAVIDTLSRQADQARAFLAETGTADLHHARVGPDVMGSWHPEIVLIAGDLTPAQHDQLQAATTDLPRVAVAAVTSGIQVGDWGLRFTQPDQATLEPLGLSIHPQRLDEDTYQQLLEQFSTADKEPIPADVDALPEPTLADTYAATAAHLDTDLPDTSIGGDDQTEGVEPAPLVEPVAESVSAIQPPDSVVEPEPAEPAAGGIPDLVVAAVPDQVPRLLVLGRPQVINLHGSTSKDNRAQQYTELVALLALHGPCTAAQLDDAMKPGQRVKADTRQHTVSGARTWLGVTSVGDPYLPKFSRDDLYRLLGAFPSDWDDFQRLVGTNPQQAATTALEQALDLVQGRPFEGVPAGKYVWADTDAIAITDCVIDAAYELARRRLMDGNLSGAHAAAQIGLQVAPESEQLSRLQIKAAAADGDMHLVNHIVRRASQAAADIHCDLDPETEALLIELNRRPQTRSEASSNV